MITHREDSLAAKRADRPATKTALQIKLEELAAACSLAIFAGVDAETTRGGEHFSLTIADQTNIACLTDQARNGHGVTYHADGKLCRTFEPQEFLAVSDAAAKHKAYHTTLCNHLNVWARRTADEAKLKDITYGGKLPKDLAKSFEALTGADV